VEMTRYLAIARRWSWLLILTTALGGLTAWTVSQLVTPTYRATATLLVIQQQQEGSIGIADLQASERLANTFTRLVTVRSVLEEAIARGGLALTPEQLEERLSVSSPPTTQLLEITAEASDPEAARDIANVVGETFIASNEASIGTRPGIVSIVERAQTPLEPSAPSPTLNALTGAILAFLATGAIVAMVEYLDDTVKTDEAVAQLTGLPIVGYVTQFARAEKPGDQLRVGVDPHSREAEAYRSMRTNITFSMNGAENGAKRLLVTSAGPGEGKSTTAANLAVVFGLAGSRVLLIDADLRRPAQHRIFNIPNTSGLTSLLANSGVRPQQAVQRTTAERVWLLPSGPVPGNPSELLGSGHTESLLDSVQQHFDIVILDTPPVLAVTDPAVLSSVVTASVIVVQHGKTRSEELRSAVQRLAVAGKPIAGVILNRVAKAQPGYYYADYRTRQTAAAAERRATPRGNGRPARPAADEERRIAEHRPAVLTAEDPAADEDPPRPVDVDRTAAGG
jgi:polysaccharide biosynthesis transport protein